MTMLRQLLCSLLLGGGLLFTAETALAEFKPQVESSRLLNPTVRPGSPLVLELTFTNAGEPPTIQYNGFIHLERGDGSQKAKPECDGIISVLDFGVDWWKTGGDTYRGTYSITIPENMPEGERFIHTGLWLGETRFCEAFIPFTVDADAPESARITAPPPTAAELAERQQRLNSYFTRPDAELGNANYAFALQQDGRWRFTDKLNDSVYYSNLARPAFGLAAFGRNGEKRTFAIDNLQWLENSAERIRFAWTAETPDAEAIGQLEFTLEPDRNDRTLHVSWRQTGGDWELTDVIFPDESFASTGEEGGVLVIPNRLGILMYATENLPSKMSWLTYDGYGGLSMAMAGVGRNGSGILLWWKDADTALTGQRSWTPANLPGATAVDLTLSHKGKQGEVYLVNVGSGEPCAIANAYRDGARAKGFLVTMREKYGEHNPIDGVMSFRPMALYNFAPNTRWNETDQRKIRVGYSFGDVADTAEFLKDRLGLDRVMITIMGWIHRGYDNQHPDVLPAAPEAGGNEALLDCVQRIRRLGYLIGLHDNYGDFYPDAPSWSEDYVQRMPDGSLRKGGVWWGGQCYLVNPTASLQLARRNLPEIKKLFPLNYYYIDTTFAVPLSEDFNPLNPMDRNEDVRRKQAMCKFARDLFGLFGSEEGVEWGVPVADYAESMLFQRTKRQSGEVLAPLFEMVYGDCFVICEGDRTLPATPEYVLDHLICAEMPQAIFNKAIGCDLSCRIAGAEFISDTAIALQLEWQSDHGSPKKDYPIFLHLDRHGSNVGYKESALAGSDFVPEPAPSAWQPDTPVRIAPVQLPLDRTADGYYDVMVGMLDNGERLPLRRAVDLGHTRYLIGHLKVENGKLTVEPPQPPAESCFSRLDGNPEFSYTNEGFLMNLDAIFSPLMARTRDFPMTGHRFLSPDRKVEQSEFGGVRITVNYGDEPYDTGRFVLPKWGFCIESDDFLAFRADSADDRRFSETTLMTVEKQDERLVRKVIYGDDAAVELRSSL